MIKKTWIDVKINDENYCKRQYRRSFAIILSKLWNDYSYPVFEII
jgi:hypothetical protein